MTHDISILWYDNAIQEAKDEQTLVGERLVRLESERTALASILTGNNHAITIDLLGREMIVTAMERNDGKWVAQIGEVDTIGGVPITWGTADDFEENCGLATSPGMAFKFATDRFWHDIDEMLEITGE